MSLPDSLLSYEAQLQFMEMALDDDRGMRMFFRRPQEAEHFRMRCNYARVLTRRENKLIHEPGTPLYGKSVYDVLVFTVKTSPDGYWVYAKRQVLDTSLVEPIPDEDESPPLDVKQIIAESTDDNKATPR